MIDWVHAKSPIIDEIVARSGLGGMPTANIEAAIVRYAERTPTPPSAWIAGTSDYGSLSEPLAGDRETGCSARRHPRFRQRTNLPPTGAHIATNSGRGRSEERPVGKEGVSQCRSRLSTYHSKKK